MTPADVVVIGGGPAGSTCAGLLARYNPGARIVLAEAATFPRYHLGESLIIENNVILEDLGALEAVAAAGFERKGGATFVWGRDREPWSLRFHEGRGLRGDMGAGLDHAWHVDRSRYDQILLDVARGHGVDVLQPARVVDVGFGATGGTVRLETPDGELTIDSRFVVDAGGRRSVLARRFGERQFDPVLRNVAIHGYWSGVRPTPELCGPSEARHITAVSAPGGWIWSIPLGERTSVGYVTSHAAYRGARPDDLRRYYCERLRDVPEVAGLLEGATLVEGAAEGKTVRVEADFNYAHDTLVGEAWALVGDAAGFVDPIFSVGVLLAQSSARLLAYTLGSVLFDDAVGASRAELLAAYQTHVKAQFTSFLAMAHAFYGFNRSKEEFWALARELAQAQGVTRELEDREAFLARIFGFGVNLPVVDEAASCFGKMAGLQIANVLLGKEGEPGMQLPSLAETEVIRLNVPHHVRSGAVPVSGKGRVFPMAWVEFDAPTGETTGFPRHVLIPRPLTPLVDRLEQPTRVRTLLEEAASISGWRPAFRAEVFRVLAALDGFGVLDRNP